MPVAYPCKCGHTEKYCTCVTPEAVEREMLWCLLRERDAEVSALRERLRRMEERRDDEHKRRP